ncbi:MAG: hypothetical protein ACI9R3_003140 [Verrucomicrobiales bacterium]|jgi:hypothetical protein
MKKIYVSNGHRLQRRTFLRGVGSCFGLPLLEAMSPSFAAAEEVGAPRRMVAIQTNQGIMPQFFFPEKTGRDFAMTPYLERLAGHRERMTVFSGVSLPGVDGGHAADKCFLTATPHPARGGFRNGISLDQLAADTVGNETRYPSLVLAMTNENRTLSYTRSGAPIPAENSPRKLFEKLFMQGRPDEVESRVEALRQGRSMLDFIGDQSKRFNRTLSNDDQHRMDQYFTSVRELERRMHSAEEWQYKPKPKVDADVPQDNTQRNAFGPRTQLMFDVMKLAMETDSTRIISLFVDTTGLHNLTHHGGRPDAISELKQHETDQFDALNHFLTSLSEVTENDVPLLDHTMVLYGTCMGSANSHTNLNLPVLLAGGGFKHGQHLAYDAQNNYPLSNLYVSMLQRLGMEVDAFATSQGTMRGLEMS